MSNIVFEDFSVQVKETINDRINIALEEAAGELEAATKRRTRVDTGQLKSNWQHVVDEAAHTAYIGNPLENAIWEEFGTGEYALNKDGRKGGWYIPIGENGISEKVAKSHNFPIIEGKDGKKFAFTRGKKPRRTLHNAYKALKKRMIVIFEDSLRGL